MVTLPHVTLRAVVEERQRLVRERMETLKRELETHRE